MLSIDDIEYGVINSAQEAHKDAPTPLFDCGAFDLPLIEPPANSSEETRLELKHMMQVREDAPLPESFLRDADRDMTGLFVQRIKDSMLIPPVWVYDLSMQSSVFTVNLKDHFQRPRPYQIAPMIGDHEFHPMPTETGHSPSYPSGHSLQAHVLGAMLERMFGPSYGFVDLAEAIALSRVQMGIHFPSDIHYGRYLADRLIEHVRI